MADLELQSAILQSALEALHSDGEIDHGEIDHGDRADHSDKTTAQRPTI